MNENGLRQGEIKLNEIRTRLDDYRDFLDSLAEISEQLGLPSGTGMFISDIVRDYEIDGKFHDLELSSIYGIRLSRLTNDKDFLATILLYMWRNAHAKMGEISLLLEQSIESLEIIETKELDKMERSTAREE